MYTIRKACLPEWLLDVYICAYLNGDGMGYTNTFLPLFRADEGQI